jgi:omega-amidase
MQLTEDIDKNVEKIVNYAECGQKRGLSLLCYPECALSGYIVDHSKIRAESIRNAISRLQHISDQLGISLLVGTPWPSNNNIYNSAVIIQPHAPRRIYRKNNLTEYDKRYFSKGNSKLMFRVCGIRCGILICRDQNNPSLAKRYKNIKILFYLSSHYYAKEEAIKKERKNKAFPIVRALENNVYVAKADAVGEQNGKISIGGSIVVNPQGYVIAEAEKYREDMLEFNL